MKALSRAFTTVVVAYQECEKSSFHSHEKRLNEFMMKSKLKQRRTLLKRVVVNRT